MPLKNELRKCDKNVAREVFSKGMTFKLGPKCYREASYTKILMKRHLDRIKSRIKP